MNLDHLSLSPFMAYKALSVTFPERGVVLVVGPNGVGKSTIVEGIAWGLYGETVRGTTPGECSVSVTLGALQVTRQRNKKGQVTLKIEGLPEGLTVTETQARIDTALGNWRRFSSARVFSRELMTRFGLATDKERKALLEGMFGLEHFDLALKVVREDLATATAKARVIESHIAEINGRLSGLRERVVPVTDSAVNWKGTLAQCEQASLAAKAERDSAVKLANAAADVAAKAEVARYVAVADEGKVRKEIALLRAQWLERKGLGDCPVCLRAIGEGDLGRVREHFEREIKVKLAETAKLAAHAEALTSDASEALAEKIMLTRMVEAFTQAYIKATDATVQARRAWEVAQAVEKAEAELSTRIATVQAELESKLDEAVRVHHEQLVLAAADEALGLQGARNALLRRALQRLEQATNGVLAKLGGDRIYRVAISGTTVQKNRKEVDKVSIEVEGAGAGEYRGASGGEKARLDVALLLGLASLTAADRHGLLVFDETFDALDGEGIEKVAAFLSELGQERQVVVITHHEDLTARFPQSAVWRVSRLGVLEVGA